MSLVRKGKQGAEEISAIMKQFRDSPPENINGSRIIRMVDYLKMQDFDLISGKIRNIELPKSNVLQYYTDDDSKISIRPSGTEPKIKFYISVNTTLDSAENYEATIVELQNKIKSIESEIVPSI